MRSFLARLRPSSRKPARPTAHAALPSFHPSFEQLESRLVPTVTYHGGPLLTNVEVQAVFYGADWQNNATLTAQTGDVANYLSYIVDSSYMDMLTNAGYGVSRGSYQGGTIDPADLSGGTDGVTIENELVSLIDNGALQPPDANSLYFVYVQPGTAVAGSALGAGYHNSFTAPDGSAINYAVVNSAADPTTGAADWNAISGTGTHELAEAVTDSNNGWWDDDLTAQQAALGLSIEIADMVNGQAVYLNGYQVGKVVDQNDVPIQPDGSTSLIPTGQDVTATTGATWTGTLATFQELDVPGVYGDYSYGDYSAQIDWGDGQTSAGQIVDNGDGTFSVVGSDTYNVPGSHTIQVAITDNADGDTATATDTATVTGPVATTTDVAATPSTLAYGYPFTLTAAVTSDAGVPVGTVSFLDGATFLGAAPLTSGGTASLTVTTLTPGDHTMLAVFSGGSYFESSTSAPVDLTILPPPPPAATGTAVAVTPGTPVYGYPVTLTAAVTSDAGVPVGTVSFLDGATFLGAAPLTPAGTATLTVTTFTPGPHTILAVFSAGGNFASSTSPPAVVTALTGTATGLAASTQRAAIGEPITLSVGVIAGATVPTGTVTFLDNGFPIGTVPLSAYGNATLPVTNLPRGSYRFTAQFNGTGGFAASTSQPMTVSVGLAATATPGAYDPTTGIWYLHNSNAAGAADAGEFAYGGPGFLPVVGDWNGDGVATIGVYEEATGTWLLKNSNTPGAPDLVINYGGPGYLPVVGDWTGDGITTIGVYDMATGTWLLRNSNTPGAPDITFAYGGAGMLPVVGDWTGNGKTTVGVYQEDSGAWLLRNSNTSGAPNLAFNYGGPGMTPVVGDWNGDGITTVGVFDTASGKWLLKNNNVAGAPDLAFAYGVGDWAPVAGNWDGLAQLAANLHGAAHRTDALDQLFADLI